MLRLWTRLYEDVPEDLEMIQAYEALPLRRRQNWLREMLALGFKAKMNEATTGAVPTRVVAAAPANIPSPVRPAAPVAPVQAAPVVPPAPVAAQSPGDESSGEPKKVGASALAGFFRS
jgi:hypothetical protein